MIRCMHENVTSMQMTWINSSLNRLCHKIFQLVKALILTFVSSTWPGLWRQPPPFSSVLYLPIQGMVLGEGGGSHHEVDNPLILPVLVLGNNPTPSLPPLLLVLNKKMGPISSLKGEVGKGVGEGQILAEIPPKLPAFRNTQLLEWRGRILSPDLSMGDRIHEHCFLESPRCPGKRENPYSGCYNGNEYENDRLLMNWYSLPWCPCGFPGITAVDCMIVFLLMLVCLHPCYCWCARCCNAVAND